MVSTVSLFCRPCESRDLLINYLRVGPVGPGFRRDDILKPKFGGSGEFAGPSLLLLNPE